MKPISRRDFIKDAAVGTMAVATAMGLSVCSRQERSPNIILIMADDFGYECVGCNGGRSYQTPALDNLARRGVRFTHCYSTPLCTPSRVQLMTGKYNFRNYTEFGTLKPGEFTFAHQLKQAGYRTAVTGKWQLVGHYEGSHYRGVGTYPKEAGFDQYCLWQVDQLGSRYWNPVINQNGKILDNTRNRYGPDIFCDFAIHFIEQNRHRPFFLYYPMVLTHAPFVPTSDEQPSPDERGQGNKAHFPAMVNYADQIVGRIVQAIDNFGLAETTLLIFTGDNGTPRGIISQWNGQSIAGGKGSTTTAGTHVPLLASWQGKIPAGSVCHDLVDFTDFFPTLSDVAGKELPRGSIFDGRSFLPQLLGEKGNPRDWIFCHYDPRWGKWQKRRYVQNKRYKLYDDGSFYDIQSDPLEKVALDLTQLSVKARQIERKFRTVLDRMK